MRRCTLALHLAAVGALRPYTFLVVPHGRRQVSVTVRNVLLPAVPTPHEHHVLATVKLTRKCINLTLDNS